MANNTKSRAEIRMYQNSIRELENIHQVLRDEHQALQITFASLEDKLRKAQVKKKISNNKLFLNLIILFFLIKK